MNKLEKLGVKITIGNGCACTGDAVGYSYKLPIVVDEEIQDYIGRSVTSMKTQGLFKMETSEYKIIAVSKLKLIKLTFKKEINTSFIGEFENKLYSYIENKTK